MDPYLFTLLVCLGALVVSLTIIAYASLAERKVAGWIQQRPGPNRVGPWGMLQPLADVLKLALKEDIVPRDANRFYHFLAPVISVTMAFAILAVLPYGPDLIIFNSNISILYLLAVQGIAVYGITLAGWASNNKYSLLGGLRASASMLSYEISLGLCLVSVILLTNAFTDGNALSISSIVEGQRGHWYALINPIGFLIFGACVLAEANRTPFDLIEAEQELVGGYHTEFSSLRFASFMLVEFAHVFLSAAIITTVFFGGYLGPLDEWMGVQTWHPFWENAWGVAMFLGKVFLFMFIIIWVRWTLPRFRYDQLMNIGWKSFLPITLANLFVVALVAYFLAK
jgi:NADH-quinone oxidoreductase subunit H